MTTLIQVGKQLKEIDLVGLFSAQDGEITQRYGRIGQGKTYGATNDAYNDLMRGEVVYTNWRMNFEGVDQRESWLFLIGGILFPWVNNPTFTIIAIKMTSMTGAIYGIEF